MNFEPAVNQNIELWAVVEKQASYIRTLNDAIEVSRSGQIISNRIDKRIDKILLDNSSFGDYLEEFEKIFRYRENILTKNTYMNGRKRVAKGKASKLLYGGLDILKSKMRND